MQRHTRLARLTFYKWWRRPLSAAMSKSCLFLPFSTFAAFVELLRPAWIAATELAPHPMSSLDLPPVPHPSLREVCSDGPYNRQLPKFVTLQIIPVK